MKAEGILLAIFVFLILSMPAIGQTDQPITCKQGNYFIQNVGQLDDPSILYYSDIPTGRICVRQDDIVFQFIDPPLKNENGVIARPSPENRFRGDFPYREKEEPCPLIISNVYVTFSGSDFTEIIPEDEQVTKINIFKGNDPNKWRTDIPTFGAVRIRNLYENVDLVIGGDRNDPEAPIWHLEGDADRFSFLKMSVDTDLADEKIAVPMPEKQAAREEKKTESRLQLQGQQLLWGTYLGGAYQDWCKSVYLRNNENILLAGIPSSGIPTPNGYDQIYDSSGDMYVAELSSDGRYLLWGTFLGGSGFDQVGSVREDSLGGVIVAGITESDDIPVPGGYDRLINDDGDPRESDIYVARLFSSGNGMSWGTYLGGSSGEHACSMDLDSNGNVLVAAETISTDMPVPNGFDQTYNGGIDIFIAKLASSGEILLWGTYIGSDGSEYLPRVKCDENEALFLAAHATSTHLLPLFGGYDSTWNGGGDIYLAKFAPDGGSLFWATLLGGSGDDYPEAILFDSSGNIIIGGETDSPNMPVKNGYDSSFNGGYSGPLQGAGDIYLAKLDPAGKELVWATYLGGSDNEAFSGMALDENDSICLCGWTYSDDMPAMYGYSILKNGENSDAYFAKISSAGDTLLWGSFFSGSRSDTSTSIFETGDGIILVGSTFSEDLPFNEGYDITFNGQGDFYLAKLSFPVCRPPVIARISKKGDPFRIFVEGSDFQSDAKVFIGGDNSPWPTVVCKSENLLLLKGGNSLKKKFPKGVPVEIKVVNGDWGSATITYTR